MLSIMPPVLPILNAPGLIPPTVAGPTMQIPFFWATWRISRARYLVRCLSQILLKSYPFRHAFGDDGNALDLGVLHQLHGGAVDGAGRGEVDDGVDLGVLLHGLLDRLVNRKESLRRSPVPRP
jgi:hypothetical protein